MITDHFNIVVECRARQPPATGPFPPEQYGGRLLDFFAFQQRVMARLALEFPGERWGYLAIGGENVVDHRGRGIKVGRVCGPDGQLYKIGTDIPTTNDPIWTDDGIVQHDHGGQASDYYVAFDGAAPGPVDPPPPPPVDPPPVPTDPDLTRALLDLVTVMQSVLAALRTNESMNVLRHDDLTAKIADVERRIFGTKAVDGLTLSGKFLGYPITFSVPRPTK